MNAGAGLTYRTSAVGSYKVTEFLAGDDDVTFSSVEVAVSSDEDILQEIILEDSIASVTFENLSQYASTYQHLQIRATYRSNRSASTGGAGIRFNADSGATNYTRHWLQGDKVTMESDAVPDTNLMDLGAYTATTATANTFAASIVDILDPFESTKYTTIRRLSGYAANVYNITLGSGVWMNTAALTEIEIFDRFSTFVAGSRFTLIGLK
jgi:hypothetical protein